MFHLDKLWPLRKLLFFQVIMALIDWKVGFPGKMSQLSTLLGCNSALKNTPFLSCLADDHHPETADRECRRCPGEDCSGAKRRYAHYLFNGTLSKVLIINCVGLFSISETCLVPSVNLEQFFGKWTMCQTTNQPSHLITWLLWRLWVAEGHLDRCWPVASVCFLQEWTFTRICLDSGRRRDWRDASWAKL